MKIYHNIAPKDFRKYGTEEIRDGFLIENLFQPNQIITNYTHVDRMMVLGAQPVDNRLYLQDFIDNKQLGTDSFLERREMGIINIGGKATVFVNDDEYPLDTEDALYLGKEAGNIAFASQNRDNPAKLYIISVPAHRQLPIKYIKKSEAKEVHLGAQKTSNERIIRQYLHPDVVETCQLCMGLTSLAEGSVWNTMPAHTHERRMETYLYFDIKEEQIVFHYMGEANHTRHVVMQNEQAVISPSWSLHSGCGTSNYKFIWAMAGENQTFDDMDFIKNTDLR
ncbi:MAG: 5-dehydro-4-deoxy-D-glucuronate isomerase [Alphaproteobacteria bacterium]